MKRIGKNKKIFILPGLLILVCLLMPEIVLANSGVENAMSAILGAISSFFVMLIGVIITLFSYLIINVAQFSKFIDIRAVEQGWMNVRDLCNMFFILILLVIAFGTMLRQENYAAKKLLPKVLIMAILINFSKMFFGLIIDFSQVIMLAFVRSLHPSDGHFVSIFIVDDWLSMEKDVTRAEMWGVVLAQVFALIAAVVTAVVLAVFLAVLVMRIVMLWIYTIFSPFVFLGWAFPPLQKYTNQIWEDFIKQVMVGPILAFFIWLALWVGQTPDAIGNLGAGDITLCTGVSGIMCADSLQKFIIVIGLLMGGLMMAQQMGGAAGSIAGKGIGAIKAVQGAAAGRVKDWTGVSAAQKYMAMRKTAREEKINLQAGRMAERIGGMKKSLISKPSMAVSEFFDEHSPLRKNKRLAKEANEDVENLKNQMADSQAKIASGEGFKLNGQQVERKDGQWKIGSQDISEEALYGTVEEHYSENIKTKQKEAKEYEKKQKRMDYIGVLAKPIADKFKNAGETDLNLPSTYTIKKVGDAKEKMKLDSDTEVVATLNDSSKDSFTRIAAAMEAVSRKLLNTDEAEYWKNFAQEKTGGTKDGTWKNKTIGSQFEALLEKNHPSLTGDFGKLKSAEEDEADKIRSRISSGFQSDKYNLENMDSSSIKLAGKEMAASMKTPAFVNQYKALKDQSKKAAIVNSLQSAGSYEAKEKLAFIKNMGTAFVGDLPGRKKFAGNLTPEKMLEMTREGKRIEARLSELSPTAQSFITNGSQDGQTILSNLTLEQDDRKAKKVQENSKKSPSSIVDSSGNPYQT